MKKDRVETVLGEKILTRQEVADQAGVPLDRATALWRAMGFQQVGDVVAFTEADLKALQTLQELIESGPLGEDEAVSEVRSVSLHLSRLAEWQALNLLERSGSDEKMLETLNALEKLVGYVWRRHLAASLERSGESREVLAIGFADLVGYTSLVRSLDKEELDCLLERFESVATNMVTLHGGRIVKSLGDAVLFAFDHAEAAAECSLQLAEAFRQDDILPDLRVGLAYGPVHSRFGDVYGSTVNLASRLTDLARPGSVLVEEDTADALAGSELTTRVVRRRSIPDYPHLRAFVVSRGEDRWRLRVPMPTRLDELVPVNDALAVGQDAVRFLEGQVRPRRRARH